MGWVFGGPGRLMSRTSGWMDGGVIEWAGLAFVRGRRNVKIATMYDVQGSPHIIYILPIHNV